MSFDEFRDKGYEIENKDLDIETDYIEEESNRELKEKLHKAIKELTPRQQEIVRLIYFEGKTQKEVADYLGIKQPTVQEAVKRIIASLKKYF